MPTTYRVTIDTDDHRKRGMMKPGFRYDVTRRSKRTDAQAVEAFRVELTHHVAIGPNAKAWLEVSGRDGVKTLVRVTAVTTALRTLRDGHSKGPSACDWVTSDGKVFTKSC